MLIGSHVILNAKDADAARAFFRDVLGFPHVDAGEGWLIFRLPPAEMGIHPDAVGGTHRLYLMCDDVRAERARLEAKGVEFTAPIEDQGWGVMTVLRVPGLGDIGLYQPRHPMACARDDAAPAAARGAARKASRKVPRRAARKTAKAAAKTVAKKSAKKSPGRKPKSSRTRRR